MIIYAIKIENQLIASVLNFVKYLCAPGSKTEVHLSVRGPYKRKLSNNKVEEFNKIINNSIIHINGVGNFFQEGQNTVFLKCESNEIKKAWYKKGYNYVPHLTIYDGNNIAFAHDLFDVIDKQKIKLDFYASKLILYDNSMKNTSLLLKSDIDNKIIKDILDIDWLSIDVDEMPTQKKFDLIKNCFVYLSTKVEFYPTNEIVYSFQEPKKRIK